MEIPVFKFALRDDLKDNKNFLPTLGEPSATGWDVRAAQIDRQPIIVRPFNYFKIPLGFRSFCPPNWYYQLHPRSSSFAKKSMHNLIGIIDETWEGESMVVGQYIPDSDSLTPELIINFGDKIAQILPMQRQNMHINLIDNKEYNDLCNKRNGVRKSGGFGSTT